MNDGQNLKFLNWLEANQGLAWHAIERLDSASCSAPRCLTDANWVSFSTLHRHYYLRSEIHFGTSFDVAYLALVPIYQPCFAMLSYLEVRMDAHLRMYPSWRANAVTFSSTAVRNSNSKNLVRQSSMLSTIDCCHLWCCWYLLMLVKELALL